MTLGPQNKRVLGHFQAKGNSFERGHVQSKITINWATATSFLSEVNTRNIFRFKELF